MIIQCPGRGPKDAKIVFVGEAPGSEEVTHNPPTPFVGPAGKQFEGWLDRMGIKREEVYITNVVKRKLLKNDFNAMYTDAKNLKPTEELLEYWAYLERELKEINPYLIVPLGRQPLYAITGKDSIGNWRGSIIQAKWGTKVVATYHPSYIMSKDYGKRPVALKDMRRIKVEGIYPEIKLPKRDLMIMPSLKQTLDYIHECKGKIVAEDIETQWGRYITCLGLSFDPSHALCIPFIYENKPFWSPSSLQQIREALVEIQMDPKTLKVMQNGHYDWTWLKRDGLGIDRLWFDPHQAHHAAWPELPKGLDFLASIYTREPYWKDEGKDITKKILDWDEYYTYNCKDAAVTRELVDPLRNELNRTETWDTYEKEMANIPVFVDATLTGFNCDVDKKKKMTSDCRKKMIALNVEIDTCLPDSFKCIVCKGTGKVEYGRKDKVTGIKKTKACKRVFKDGTWRNGCGGTGQHLNPDSSKQVSDLIYNHLKLPKSVHPSTKKLTVDENAIKKLQVKRPMPIFKHLLEYANLSQDHGFLSCKVSEDGRLRTTLCCAAKTGRIISRTSPFNDGWPLQTLKRDDDFRSLLIADPGYVLLAPDYERAEAYTMGYEAEDEVYIDALENCQVCKGKTGIADPNCKMCHGTGRGDIHTKNASVIFLKDLWDVQKKERTLGKRVCHGLNYLMGDRTLVEAILKELGPEYAINQKQAKVFRTNYFKEYKRLLDFQHFIEEEVIRTRTIYNSFGRKRETLNRPEGKTIRDMIAHVPQSTVADLTDLWALPRVTKLPDLTFLLQVHDSIMCQVPIDKLEKSVKDMEEAMTTEITAVYSGRKYTIPVEMKVGYTWGTLMSPEEFMEKGK
jgi:DNA polymerase